LDITLPLLLAVVEDFVVVCFFCVSLPVLDELPFFAVEVVGRGEETVGLFGFSEIGGGVLSERGKSPPVP